MTAAETNPLDLCLITGIWDDLPALMTRLGYPFRNLGNSLSACQDKKLLEGCKSLYIACGAECDMNDIAAYNIRQFVANGGGLYVSDMASAAIDRLFPDQVTFSRLDYRSDNQVQVIDPGLAQQLGHSMILHMDYQNSQGIQRVSPGVKVLIEGPRNEYDAMNYPYLVEFRHGQGLVLYTVFHNANQVDEKEETLLRYLILKPWMTDLAKQMIDQFSLPGGNREPSINILSAVNPNQPAEVFHFRTDHVRKIRLMLGWQRQASYSLQITSSMGQRIKFLSSDQSPMIIDFIPPKTGEYLVTVKGIQIPSRNFPYILLID